MERAWVRRPVMTLAVASMAAFLLVTLPLWVPLLLVADVLRAKWRLPLLRFTTFGLLWAWLETLGLCGAFLVWIFGQSHNQSVNYRLQRWWTRGVIGALSVTVGLHIDVEGAENLGEGPFIALCRHASLADSIMSAWVFITKANLRPRYVLKKELQLDPCLDVVGHRLDGNRTGTRRCCAVAGFHHDVCNHVDTHARHRGRCSGWANTLAAIAGSHAHVVSHVAGGGRRIGVPR